MTKSILAACLITASLAAIGTSLLVATPAKAQATTDQMTCAQVVAAYEKNRRIYVRSRTGQVLPIYSGVPVSQRSKLRCGRGRGSGGYRVKTKDNKRCVAMYVCS